MVASDAAAIGVAKVDLQNKHLAYLSDLAKVKEEAVTAVEQAQQWLDKVRKAETDHHKQHGADMAEMQACWVKCDKLAQQEGSSEKIAGLSKGVLVDAWNEEVAKMTPEEKVFAARYGNALHVILAKGQQDKDTQEAPELNLTQAAPSGAATTKPSDTKPSVTKPPDTKPSDTTKTAAQKPVDPPPKNDRDVAAGETPAKLPKKEGDGDAAMDDDDDFS